MSEELRLVFLNYARLVTADYCEPFAALLEDPRQGMECRLAVLRYFRKYHYPPVWEKILSYVENYRENNWEYASVAALTLQNYPGQRSVQALKKALSSPNWYVRYNAAESLRVLGADYLDLMDVLNGNDRYAREMLEFQLGGLKGRRDPA